jgi:hypothetical protein
MVSCCQLNCHVTDPLPMTQQLWYPGPPQWPGPALQYVATDSFGGEGGISKGGNQLQSRGTQLGTQQGPGGLTAEAGVRVPDPWEKAQHAAGKSTNSCSNQAQV